MKYMFSVIVFIITFLILELLLKLFFPFTFATIGHVRSKNSTLYGWGYNPHEIIKIRDPDTGEVYSNPANNHGWRDKDRTFDNHEKSYRILVLGDSFTFGATVPAEKTYTRILEDLLHKDGFNVEVINIAYGGWGTDHELEALKNEGLKYKPQLVIVQFHINDLRENLFFANKNEQRQKLMPFYYTIDDNAHLVRHNNHDSHDNWKWKDRIKYNILKWEIGKRLYSIYFIHKWREIPVSRKEDDLIEKRKQRVAYSVSKSQIEQLKLSINFDSNGLLQRYLNENINKEIDVKELINTIKESGYEKDRNIILRVLEKRSFHTSWSRKIYYPKKQDINSLSWKLYFALINKANSLITEKGAQLALFCHNDLAHYNWNVYWRRISNDPESRKNFLQYHQIIQDYSRINNIDFIENKRSYQFARNDPHPNVEGNKAMALDIYDYLMKNHNLRLNSYRSLYPVK